MIICKFMYKYAIFVDPQYYDEMYFAIWNSPPDRNTNFLAQQFYLQTLESLSKLSLGLLIINLSKWSSRRWVSFHMAIFMSSYNIFNYALMHLTDCKFILNKNQSMKELWNEEPKQDEDVKML